MDINTLTTALSENLSNYSWMKSWVIQVFIVVLLTLVVDFVQRRVLNRLYARLEQTPSSWDEVIIEALRKPLTVFIMIVGLGVAVDIIQKETQVALFDALDPLRVVGVIATFAWFLIRLIQQAEVSLIAQREAASAPYDRSTFDAVAKLLRASVVITATLVTLQTLGFSVSGVLAFGGIGGIAVGFAAKDLLANFFGGLMIYLDRPFSVGEWIRSPDRDIEGTVEQIGWRLTRIRTFDMRPLYVPNATFTSIAVENPSRMFNRRIHETIGIRYDDAPKMAAIVHDVEQMLRTHPEIDTRQTLMVNFNVFAPSSLDFFIYTFTKTTKWAHYHQVKQDVLLRIIDIIAQHDAQIAFPTSTIHVPETLSLQQEIREVAAEPPRRKAHA